MLEEIRMNLSHGKLLKKNDVVVLLIDHMVLYDLFGI